MSCAVTMYGQSCIIAGCGGVNSVRFSGASLCWGRRVILHIHCSAGICKAIHRPSKALVAAAEQRV